MLPQSSKLAFEDCSAASQYKLFQFPQDLMEKLNACVQNGQEFK